MNAPDHRFGGAAPGHRTGGAVGRLLLVVALGLALLAAALLVLTDEPRWLRLAVVAGLWAALVAAFAAARYRRDLLGYTDRSAELQRVYELELEREVAARREYEQQVEATTRRKVEEEVRTELRGELNGLRSELGGLRQNLEALLGGEVLVERVALRAESTRLRSLSDQSRAARAAERALPRGRSDARPAGDPQRTPDWTPEAGRAYAADAGVLSPARAASEPRQAGRAHPGDSGDRTDVLPQYHHHRQAAGGEPRPAAAWPSAAPQDHRPGPARQAPVRPVPLRPASAGQDFRSDPEVWRVETGRFNPVLQPVRDRTPADRTPADRTGPPLLPAVRDARSGPPSDPLGIDPHSLAGAAAAERPAWGGFDSWVAGGGGPQPATGGRAQPTTGGGPPRRPDDTGSYVMPEATGRAAEQEVAGTGRRHRSDDSTRTVDQLIAAYRNAAQPVPRHRREV